jgi:hypothetical protein
MVLISPLSRHADFPYVAAVDLTLYNIVVAAVDLTLYNIVDPRNNQDINGLDFLDPITDNDINRLCAYSNKRCKIDIICTFLYIVSNFASCLLT